MVAGPKKPVPSLIGNGSPRLNQSGYVHVTTTDGVMREHTFMMENLIGRKLVPGENVHHIDGIRDNNDPENLELWWRPQPSGQRVRDLIRYMAEYHFDDVVAYHASRPDLLKSLK